MPTTNTTPTPTTRTDAVQKVIETLVTRSGLNYPQAQQAANLILADLGWAV